MCSPGSCPDVGLTISIPQFYFFGLTSVERDQDLSKILNSGEVQWRYFDHQDYTNGNERECSGNENFCASGHVTALSVRAV